ncbi:MAG: hypothetical protein K0R76_262 [Alphaproteobacteria bacterium]|nr:hypothetical protein [Alphaproteobacteria bacterium]
MSVSEKGGEGGYARNQKPAFLTPESWPLSPSTPLTRRPSLRCRELRRPLSQEERYSSPNTPCWLEVKINDPTSYRWSSLNSIRRLRAMAFSTSIKVSLASPVRSP